MGRRAGLLTFGVTAVIALLAFATSVMVARYLGPEGRGLLLAFIVWPTLLFGVFLFSVNEAAMHQIGRSRAAGDGAAKGLAEAAVMAHMVVAVLVPPLVVVLLPWVLGDALKDQLALLLPFAFVFIALSAFDLSFGAILQGRGEARKFSVQRLVQPVSYAIGLIVLIVSQAVRLEAVLAVTLMASGLSALVGMALAGFPRPRWDMAMFGRLATASRQIHPANLLVYLAAEADKLVVVRWLDVASAGHYAVALAMALAGSQLVVQSFTVLAYAKISGTAQREQQVALVCRFGQIAFLMLLLGNGLVALILPWLLPAVFGAQFAGAVPIALILLLMTTARSTRQVLDRALRAMLDTRPGMVSEAVGLACFAASAPFGASLGGLAGIAWAMAGAQLVALVAMLLLTARRYHLPVRDLLGLRLSTTASVID